MNIRQLLMVSALVVTTAVPALAQSDTGSSPTTVAGQGTAPVGPPTIKGSEVGRRAENQQDRIANGVASGQLTAGETATLEKRDAGINKEIRTDRAANGGTLTKAEKAKINRQQNRVSGAIFVKKHNRRTQ